MDLQNVQRLSIADNAAKKIFEDFSELKIKIRFPEGKLNLEARDDIKIADTAPIVRPIEGEPQAGDLVQRRWSWPGRGKPVYNFRSDGREFTSGRCVIPADGFYEFTEPTDKRKKRNLAPYRDRQIAILDRADWAARLDPSVSAKAILKQLPAGTLAVEQVG